MSILGTTFIKRFEEHFPLALAEAGDPVGLNLGSLDKPIHKVMFTLDVRPEVVAEAITKKVDLIVAKHPVIFRPIKELSLSNPQNKMYADLLKHDIAVYAAHTNMDIVEDGLNDWFCDVLKIQEPEFVSLTHEIPYLKLAVYVPEAAAEDLREKLIEAGAGQIGTNYEGCSFTSQGEGRFTPINQAEPTIGKVNQREVVSEVKIEMILLETVRKNVLAALMTHHPYEEPGYDLYYLANPPKQYGLGRIGNLTEAITLEKFVEEVKESFKLDGLRLIADNPGKMIQRVAICGGSGEKFYRDALKAGADVYITGDVYYHTAHDMLAEGLAVIDPGHHIEVLCQSRILAMCREWQQTENWDLELIESTENTNPFKFY